MNATNQSIEVIQFTALNLFSDTITLGYNDIIAGLTNPHTSLFHAQNVPLGWVTCNVDIIEDRYLFMKENQEITIQMYKNTPIDIVLPSSVELKVIKAEPAVKGDTVTSTNKIVTCETGLEISVPMFIEENETIKVDTKNKSYITRL